MAGEIQDIEITQEVINGYISRELKHHEHFLKFMEYTSKMKHILSLSDSSDKEKIVVIKHHVNKIVDYVNSIEV